MNDQPPRFVPQDPEQYPRRKRIRLAGFDYRARGPYLVTIAVHRRRRIFGVVRGGHLALSTLGDRVRGAIDALPQKHPGLAVLASVVMPDHVHIILILPPAEGGPPARRGPSAGSLGAVVGAFKSAVARASPEVPRPLWQARFHDRIIRDEDELAAAIDYVLANPRRWATRP